MIESGIGEVTREDIVNYFPNLDALHEDTEFKVFREYIPRDDRIEITVYWREPDGPKMRMDANWYPMPFDGDQLPPRPQDLKITLVCEATKASRLWD